MPKDVYRHLKRVWVCGQQLKISKMARAAGGKSSRKPKKRKGRSEI
jgi:ATP-dependent RNA helicase DeaD